MPWDGKRHLIAFGADNSLLSYEEIVREVNEHLLTATNFRHWRSLIRKILIKCKNEKNAESSYSNFEKVPVTVKIIDI